MQELYPLMAEVEVLVLAAPIYYLHPTASNIRIFNPSRSVSRTFGRICNGRSVAFAIRLHRILGFSIRLEAFPGRSVGFAMDVQSDLQSGCIEY